MVSSLLAAGACGSEINPPAENPSPVTANTSSISIPANLTKENATQIIESDILIKLSINKNTYVPGELVLITASVDNLSPGPVEYALANEGDPTPYVYLEDSPYFHGFPLEENPGVVRTVLPRYNTGQLNPNEPVTRNVVWDQMILFKNQQAPEGTYSARCGITLGNYQDRSSLKPLSVSLHIYIVGAPEWITPEQAEAIALDLPEVTSWREEHSGKNLINEVDPEI